MKRIKYLTMILSLLSISGFAYAAIPNAQQNEIALPDHNKNGIRDDVDVFINKNFKNPIERQSVQQYARNYQNRLLGVREPDRLAKELDLAEYCLKETFDHQSRFKTIQTRKFVQSKFHTSPSIKARAREISSGELKLKYWSEYKCSCDKYISVGEMSFVKRLMGADTNQNGIRDSIDTYIERMKLDAGVKQYYRDYAKKLQHAILIDYRDAGAVLSTIDAIKALEGNLKRNPDIEKKVINEIKLKTLNTMHRIKAYERLERVESISEGRVPLKTCHI